MVESTQNIQREAKTEKNNLRFNRERCTICGSLLLRLNRSRHWKTKKHKDANYVQHELFELLPIKKTEKLTHDQLML